MNDNDRKVILYYLVFLAIMAVIAVTQEVLLAL